MINKKLKVGNVPNLRFPGFEGDWKQVNLGECSISLDYGMNAAAKSYDGVNKYIRITDIDESSSRYKYENPVSPSGSIDEKYLVGENEILFARTGASTGKSYLYHNDDGKIYFAGFLIRAKIKNQYNSKFIFSQTQTEKYSKWVQLMSMRSGQPGINSQEYSSFKFFLPLTKAEQDKIASFLSVIDKRIYTQNKIIKELAVSKTTFAKKIFLQEVRFKDDNGNDYPEWEEKKLKQVATIQMGQSPESSSYNIENIGMPLVQGNADILNRKSHPRQYTSKPTKFSEIGDIILTVRAPVGYVAKSNQKTCIGRGVCSIKNNEKSTINFLYQFLLYFEDKWKALEQGSTFTAVSSSDINSISLNVPCLEEQAKISSFLSSLDSKIDVESKLLLKLEEQKKFLLQQLFV